MYTNPRLKHVESVKNICNFLDNKYPNNRSLQNLSSQILDQCNLLLETKKKKRKKSVKYQCPQCSSSFWDVEVLKDHLRLTHYVKPTLDPKEESKCQCKKTECPLGCNCKCHYEMRPLDIAFRPSQPTPTPSRSEVEISDVIVKALRKNRDWSSTSDVANIATQAILEKYVLTPIK